MRQKTAHVVRDNTVVATVSDCGRSVSVDTEIQSGSHNLHDQALGHLHVALGAFENGNPAHISRVEQCLRSAQATILQLRSLEHPIVVHRWQTNSAQGHQVGLNENAIAGRQLSHEPVLSILIPTLQERGESLGKLLTELKRQVEEANLGDRVEVLTFCDNRELAVGTKRNSLLMRASGRFLAFVDDDDEIHPTYLSSICSVLERYPDLDCVGFLGELAWAGADPEPTIYSLRYQRPEDRGDTLGYYVRLRPIQHLNPLRREIAIRYPFPETSFGEDAARGDALARSGELRKEYFIGDRVMYRYRYDPARSATHRPISEEATRDDRNTH